MVLRNHILIFATFFVSLHFSATSAQASRAKVPQLKKTVSIERHPGIRAITEKTLTPFSNKKSESIMEPASAILGAMVGYGVSSVAGLSPASGTFVGSWLGAIAPRILLDIKAHQTTRKATQVLPDYYREIVEIGQHEILLQRYTGTAFATTAGGAALYGTGSIPLAVFAAVASKAAFVFKLTHPQNTAIERMEVITSNKINKDMLDAWLRHQSPARPNTP